MIGIRLKLLQWFSDNRRPTDRCFHTWLGLQWFDEFMSPLSLGTGIRGLMRGMATLPQGNQQLLVVKDKVGRPQVSLG